MIDSILKFTIRADASQATGEIKRADTAVKDLGKTTKGTGDQFTVSEKNFLRVSKSLGVELTSSTQRTIDKLQGLRTHLINTGAPASDLDRVSKALTNTQKQYNDLLAGGTTKLGGFASSLTSIKNIAGSVGIAFGALQIVSFLRDGVDAAADFDRQWTKLSVILRNVPTAEMDKLREKIFALPPALGTATENVAALYQIISSGVTDPEQAFILLKNAAIAATGGFTSTSTAASAGTAIMAAYGKTVGESGHIFDVMAKTVDLGVVSFEELANQLGSVTPIAAANGVSFEELSAAVATMTVRGISAGEAVTGLRSLINSLISPSEKARETAAALGIEWTANALQTKGLAGILQQLSSNSKITSEDIAILTGRVEAQNAVAILTKGGIGELVAAHDQLQKSSDGLGASIESARKRLESAGAQWDIFKTSMTNFAASVGSDLAPAFGQLFRMLNLIGPTFWAAITGNASKLADIFTGKYSKSLDDAWLETTKLEQGTKKLDATVKPTIATGKSMVEVLKAQEAAAKKAKEEFSKLSSTFGQQLSPSIKQLTDDGTKWWFELKRQGASAGELEVALQAVIDKIQKAVDATKTIAQRFQDWQEDSLRLHEALNFVVNATDKMRAANIALANTEDPMVANNDTLILANQNIKGVIAEWDKFTGKVEETPAAWEPVKQTFTEFGEQVSTIFTDFSKGLANVVIEGKGLGSLFKEIGKTGFRALTEELFRPMHLAFEKVADIVGDLLTKAFKKAWDVLTDLFSDIGTNIGKAFSKGDWIAAAIAAAAAGATLLVSRFTRRGREKVTATGAAEDLSATVWQDIVPMARAGTITVEEGISQLNAAWAAYEQYLKDNLKDQTVIQRSITSQRVTLDEGLAALNSINRSATAAGSTVDAVAALMERNAGTVTSIKKGFEEFQRIGSFSTDFFSELANMGFAREGLNIRSMSQEIARTKDLREEFAGLRTEIQSLLPKQKNWMELFLETGEITEELSFKISQAGGDIKAFKAFSDMRSVQTQFDRLQKEFDETSVVSQDLLNLMRQYGSPATIAAFENLKHSADLQGQSMLDLANDSEASAKVIEDAFGSTSEGVQGAMQNAAQGLSTELDNIDNRLIASIQQLESSMINALNRIIVALGGIPIELQTNLIDPLASVWRRVNEIRTVAIRPPNYTGPATELTPIPYTGPSTRSAGRTIRAPGFAEGGIVTSPTLAMIGERGPEAVVPLNQGMGGIVIERMTIVSNDPQKWAEDLKRMVQNNRGDMKRFLKQQLIGTS